MHMYIRIINIGSLYGTLVMRQQGTSVKCTEARVQSGVRIKIN